MNNMPFDLISLVAFIFILIVLGGFAYFLVSKGGTNKPRPTKKAPFGKAGDPGVCPVCGIVLDKGETVVSAVYPGDKSKLCHIYGCPHCYPATDKTIKRYCPICNKRLDDEQFIVTRYTERTDGVGHIHIIGCENCRK